MNFNLFTDEVFMEKRWITMLAAFGAISLGTWQLSLAREKWPSPDAETKRQIDEIKRQEEETAPKIAIVATTRRARSEAWRKKSCSSAFSAQVRAITLGYCNGVGKRVRIDAKDVIIEDTQNVDAGQASARVAGVCALDVRENPLAIGERFEGEFSIRQVHAVQSCGHS